MASWTKLSFPPRAFEEGSLAAPLMVTISMSSHLPTTRAARPPSRWSPAEILVAFGGLDCGSFPGVLPSSVITRTEFHPITTI
eukprot:2461248-Prymnesium_polylepis.1